MFAVCVNFEIEPGHFQAFLSLTRAQAKRTLESEVGCRQFDVWIDSARSDCVFLYELYDDARAFQTHLQAEYFRQFDIDSRPMIKDKQVVTWDQMT